MRPAQLHPCEPETVHQHTTLSASLGRVCLPLHLLVEVNEGLLHQVTGDGPLGVEGEDGALAQALLSMHHHGLRPVVRREPPLYCLLSVEWKMVVTLVTT